MSPEQLKDLAAQHGMVLSKNAPVSVLDVTSKIEAAKSIAIGSKDSARESVRIDMGAGHNDVNNIVQFDIANTGTGAETEVVRIGSWLGLPDSYAKYNTTKSGVDSTKGISDGFGANLLMCQGFSQITIGTPVFVKTIKLISADTTQLNSRFQHKTILPDFTIIPLVQNIAFTREKNDNATDLLVARGSWLLSSRDFLEFTSVATKSLSIVMELASISDVRQFVRF